MVHKKYKKILAYQSLMIFQKFISIVTVLDLPWFTRRQLYHRLISFSIEDDHHTMLFDFINSDQIWTPVGRSRWHCYLRKRRVQTFISEYKNRQQKCSRIKDVFERANKK